MMNRKKIIEIVLDTETTGLDYTREKIIEFAAVRLENGKIKDEFQTLINPEQHIRKSSMAIHGINEEMVKDAPTEAEILPAILEFIGDYPIVAHNAIFDYSFLNEACLRNHNKELQNPRIDTQQMFKEVFPDLVSHGLEALTKKFNVEFTKHHRAMADAMGLALAFPELKKLYFQKYDWQEKQLDNVNYLFERYLRIQQSVFAMQSELQDLRSVFKLYFDLGGEPVTAQSGETLVYQSRQSFGYDFIQIRDILEEIGALGKAVKLNTGFIDRLVGGLSLDEEKRNTIKNARQELSETRSIQVIKSDRY
ncbi:MAG: 3'-5' exonuclease [Candidatus Gastranaerophilaceae bacterium]